MQPLTYNPKLKPRVKNLRILQGFTSLPQPAGWQGRQTLINSKRFFMLQPFCFEKFNDY
jgi:hypothetical protein